MAISESYILSNPYDKPHRCSDLALDQDTERIVQLDASLGACGPVGGQIWR